MDTAARYKLVWIAVAVVVIAMAIAAFFGIRSSNDKQDTQDRYMLSECTTLIREKTGEDIALIASGWVRDGADLIGEVSLPDGRKPFRCTGSTVSVG